jgi:hypothetical protein
MAKHWDSENSRKEKTGNQKNRKQYRKPEIVIYGHIEKLTETGAGSFGDAGLGKRIKA